MERGDFLKRVIVGIAAAQGIELTAAKVAAIESNCELVGAAGALGYKALMPDYCLRIPFENDFYLIPIYHSDAPGVVPRG